MKLQYLGDSKDSFKWDYHDYLTRELELPLLNIALMMTPDDKSNDGKSHPSLFPARMEIVDFCNYLRDTRIVNSVCRLPEITNSEYAVKFHNESTYVTNYNRKQYFSALSSERSQLLFLDPDNGFEPEKSYNEKHVLYSDIDSILTQISDNSVVSVFHHFRRIPFIQDFARIKERLNSEFVTAVYWNFLMFVLITKSEKLNERIIGVNKKYSEKYPVKTIF